MTPRLDAFTLSAADLTTVLRVWLRARHEPDEVQAAALAWEIAALVARNSPDVATAFTLLDAWVVDMKRQIQTFGVGVEHP